MKDRQGLYAVGTFGDPRRVRDDHRFTVAFRLNRPLSSIESAHLRSERGFSPRPPDVVVYEVDVETFDDEVRHVNAVLSRVAERARQDEAAHIERVARARDIISRADFRRLR